MSTSLISDSYQRLAERLARAAERAGRTLQDVEILAVTKTHPVEKVREAMALGLRQVAESRVQEAEAKRAALHGTPGAEALRWHMVGHLQSNKAKKAAALFDCIQSVDGMDLAGILHREGERRAQPVSCLIEVKVSPEATKSGVAPERLTEFLDQAGRFSFLRIEGLMGLAPQTAEPAEARPYFKRLRNLFDKHRACFTVPRPILSMGMSGDCEVAVEEGSTMVRIGSALFGARAAA